MDGLTRRSRRTDCAAQHPHIPWTPPPAEWRRSRDRGSAPAWNRDRAAAPGGRTVGKTAAIRAHVTPHQVGVVPLKIGRRHHVPGENPAAKARGKTLDLILDSLGHVDRAAIGDVAICPRRLPAGWGAGRIEKTRLYQQNIRLFGDPSFPGRARSERAISSSVPPRCTVPARAHWRPLPWDWPIQHQSILNARGHNGICRVVAGS